jgi:flagellar hook assembly protein FlgD
VHLRSRQKEDSAAVSEARPAGAFSTPWDGRNDAGRDLPTGVYFADVTTGQGKTAGRVVLAR